MRPTYVSGDLWTSGCRNEMQFISSRYFILLATTKHHIIFPHQSANVWTSESSRICARYLGEIRLGVNDRANSSKRAKFTFK